MLVVRLFGQFEVQLDDRRLTIPTRNAQALFAYLVLSAGKSHRREKLAGLLWPEANENNARSNLRHELWRLRKTIELPGKSFFRIDDLTIAFNPQSDYSLDVHHLESKPLEKSSPDELIAALLPYQGELLPGFYEEWVFVERTRLHALFEAKIARLLEILQSEGRWSEVLDWGMRWIAVEQWSEPAYRAIIRAYANSGNIARAAATYEHFRQGLQKELGVKPAVETQALLKHIKTGWQLNLHRSTATGSTQTTGNPIKTVSPLDSIPWKASFAGQAPLTRFIGREKDIQQIEQLVARSRLITITGPGGMGKSRLAAQAAHELTPLFQNGVGWVELSHLQPADLANPAPGSPEIVARVIVKALQIPEIPGLTGLEGLLEHLQNKELLLVLDNCEHLVTACAAIAMQILAGCPFVVILATSREALGIAGESAWNLPPLSLPVPGQPPASNPIYQSEAVHLFIERALEIVPDFNPDDQDANTIAEICSRLDGNPLAIELAAARLNLLSLKEIAVRLDNLFSLLASGPRSAEPRHQTLLATIEWSHNLLSEPERILFRRLSVFSGGFSLEAAEEICGREGIQQQDVLSLLGQLAAKSLLQIEPARPETSLATCYRLPGTICSYARIRLDEAGETDRLLGWHSEYFR